MELPGQTVTQKRRNNAEFPALLFSESYRQLFDNMLHGFAYCKVIVDEQQEIQDYGYIYVNKAYENFGLKGRPGQKISDLMPEPKQTLPRLFEALGRIITSGTSEKYEDDVPVINKWFSFSIYSPQSGYFVVFLDDITVQKENEAKIKKLNRVYAFVSQINQAIVHAKNEHALFYNACKIALEFGDFKMSWIGMADRENKKISLVQGCGTDPEDVELFTDISYQSGGPLEQVINTGTSFICNDIVNKLEPVSWKLYAAKRGIGSCMILPLKRNGITIATFNLFSDTVYFFNEEEARLLDETAGDLSFAIDVFEKEKSRVKIEKQIAEAEANHKTIFENTSEGFVLLDNNNNIKAFNEKARNYILSNSQKTIVIGSSIYDYVEESRLEILNSIIAKVFRGETVCYERSYSIQDKEDAWFNFSMVPVREENVITGICITAQDVTDKKQAEQQREFDRNNLNSLINNTNDLMWSVDRNFKLITSNLAFDETIKLLSGHVIGKGTSVLDSAFDKEQLLRFKSYYERAFTGETFTEIEHHHGNYSEISYYPIYNNTPEIIGTACFSRDITETKRVEDNLKKSEAHLKSANKDLETYIYRASHDLRGPLSSIIGLTNVCRLEVTDEKALAYISMIGESTKKLDDTLVGLVQSISIKDITKFEDEIDFKTLLNEILDKFRFYEGFSTMQFDLDISLSERFVSSRLILVPIMQNMIENSIKYQNANVEQSYLKIRISDTADAVSIVFEDNGVGIKPVIQDKVFDVYYKGAQESKGSGLGLYIVKTGIDRLNGTIQLRSETGKGAVFTFSLPKKMVI